MPGIILREKSINMIDIFSKVTTFILIIAFAFLLKKIGFFKKEDAGFISKLIVNLTLPCALLGSAKEIQLSGVTLILIVFALIINLFAFYFGMFCSGKKSRVERNVFALNTTGYNIGNFAIPFVQTFFESSAIGYICMFDIGNAISCFGMIYYLSSSYASGERGFRFRVFFGKLLRSVPFMTYMLITFMALFHLSLPSQIMSIVGIVGNANTFLSMAMVGLLLEFRVEPIVRKSVLRILLLRIVSGVLCAGMAFLLPIPQFVKVILLFCIFTPTTSLTPVYCMNAGYDGPIPAIMSTFTMVLSIGAYVLLLLFVR